MTLPPLKFSPGEMADLLGVTQNTFNDLVRRSIAVKLKRGEYDARATVRAVVAHLQQQITDRGNPTKRLTEERERLTREQADRESIRNARSRGELLQADEVEAAWSDTLAQLRAALLALPSRLQHTMGHLTAHDIAQIDRGIRSALTEIGNDR